MLAYCGALPGGGRPARIHGPDIILAYLRGDGEWGCELIDVCGERCGVMIDACGVVEKVYTRDLFRRD